MARRDPFMHLEWDEIDFDQFIDHVTQLLIDTNWHDNAFYPPDISINQAVNMRIMGQDAGLAWREYYFFVMICRYCDFSLTI